MLRPARSTSAAPRTSGSNRWASRSAARHAPRLPLAQRLAVPQGVEPQEDGAQGRAQIVTDDADELLLELGALAQVVARGLHVAQQPLALTPGPRPP